MLHEVKIQIQNGANDIRFPIPELDRGACGFLLQEMRSASLISYPLYLTNRLVLFESTALFD